MAHSEDIPKSVCRNCRNPAEKIVYHNARLVGYYCRTCADTVMIVLNSQDSKNFAYENGKYIIREDG